MSVFSRISRQEDIKDLLPLTTTYLIPGDRKPYLDANVDETTQLLAESLRLQVRDVVTALLQLRSVVENMVLARRMVGKYPWKGKNVSKSQHLELSWFLFQSLCYNFKEKMKLFFNEQRKVAIAFGIDEPKWLKRELNLVNEALGEFITDRGNTVHSWNVSDRNVHFLSAAEMLANIGNEEFGGQVPSRYLDAKYELQFKSKKAIEDSFEIFLRVVRFSPSPAYVVERFNQLVAAINRLEAKLSAGA